MKVTTQAELDAAIASGAGDIVIDSPRGAWLEVSGSASVSASGWATVRAYGSASVSAYDSATVSAYGWATVSASGSASVSAYDSASVSAYGSATVSAYDSASVRASAFCAVHLHSARAKVVGGVLIDLTAIDLTDPQTWCDYHGVVTDSSTATLYKALGDDLTSGHQYGHIITWTPGETLTAPDWSPVAQCGNGLHVGPTAHHATTYRRGATRWVAVTVLVASIVPILGDAPKCKVPTCTVIGLVDIHGAAVKEQDV